MAFAMKGGGGLAGYFLFFMLKNHLESLLDCQNMTLGGPQPMRIIHVVVL